MRPQDSANRAEDAISEIFAFLWKDIQDKGTRGKHRLNAKRRTGEASS